MLRDNAQYNAGRVFGGVMKFIYSLLLLLSLSGFASSRRPQSLNEFPPDARALLESLPGNRITLDYVLRRAIQESDSYRAVKSDLIGVTSATLLAESKLDPIFKVQAYKFRDRTEPLSVFSAVETAGNAVSLGVTTHFKTGTSISADILHSLTDLNFANQSTLSLFETRGKFTLSQSLWKDGLGEATRLALKQGEAITEAQTLQVLENSENWFLDFVNFYYEAWFAQNRVWAALENIQRQEKLFSITRMKVNRGTSETPDLLQVETARVNAKVELANAQAYLEQIWRNLVLSLKLPTSWLAINPLYIPMALDEPVAEALKQCGPVEKPNLQPIHTSQTARLDAEAKAALARLEKAENLYRPDAQLFMTLETNGVDPKLGESFGEASSVDHPAWTIGGSVSFPLSWMSEKAEHQTAQAQRDRAEALASKARTDLQSQWLTLCSDLHRWNSTVVLYQEAFQNQVKRAQLEQDRFRLGRIPTLTIIQAGDDATRSEITLRDAERKLRAASWMVKTLTGNVKDYLKQ